jgi:hypothetical protein
MSSRLSRRKALPELKLRSWTKPELAGFAWFPSKPSTPTEEETPLHGTPQLLLSLSVLMPGWSWSDDARSPRTPGPPDKRSIVDEVISRLHGRPEPSSPQTAPETIVKRATTLETVGAPDDAAAKLHRRVELASEAIRDFPAIAKRFNPRTTTITTDSGEKVDWNEPLLEQLVLTSLGDWPSDHFLPGIEDKFMGMAMWFATMGYGAVHAAAWNDFLPTRIERTLWHLSSIYITCSGVLWVMLCSACFRYRWAKLYWDRFKYLQATWLEYLFSGSIMLACGVTYIFARMFLVVDGLVSMRVLPRDAFAVPIWTSYIPHF